MSARAGTTRRLLGPARALACAAALAACGSGGPPPKYPPLPNGCPVATFLEAPPMATDNVGPVNASCDEAISDGECLRTLQDQVCRLGGDVVWGIDPRPRVEDGRKTISGRAAKKR